MADVKNTVLKADILKVLPVTKYTPLTPYNKYGDNIPMDTLNKRGVWYSNLIANCAQVWQGWENTSGPAVILQPWEVARYNMETQYLTRITDVDYTLSDNEMPVLVSPVWEGDQYYTEPDPGGGDPIRYYFCTLNSSATDIPASATVINYVAPITVPSDMRRTSFASIIPGDVVYVDGVTAGQSQLAVYPATASPDLTDGDVKSLRRNWQAAYYPVAVGIVMASYNDGANDYITVNFRHQGGLTFGLDMPSHPNKTTSHSQLPDITSPPQVASEPQSWSTYYDEFETAGAAWADVVPKHRSHGHYRVPTTVLALRQPAPVAGTDTGDNDWWPNWESYTHTDAHWQGSLLEFKFVKVQTDSTGPTYAYKWVVAPSVRTEPSYFGGFLMKVVPYTDGTQNMILAFVAISGSWNEDVLGISLLHKEPESQARKSLDLWDAGTPAMPGLVKFTQPTFTTDTASSDRKARKVGTRTASNEVEVAPATEITKFLVDLVGEMDGTVPGTGIPLFTPNTQQYPEWLNDTGTVYFDDRPTSTDFNKYLYKGGTESETLTESAMKKVVAKIPLQVQPLFMNSNRGADVDSAPNYVSDEYNFLLSSNIDSGRKVGHDVVAPVYLGAGPSHQWSRYEGADGAVGAMVSMSYDDVNHILTLTGDTEFIPYQGIQQGGQSPNTSYIQNDVLMDPSGEDPHYKVGLPWVGCMLLANYVSSTPSYSQCMAFSYERYSGYGTKTLSFYNVCIFKKMHIKANGVFEFSSSDFPWVGSNPGYTPEDHYNPDSANYLRYAKAKVPNWISTQASTVWPNASSTSWYFRAIPVGGVRLRIIGGGAFTRMSISGVLATINDKEYLLSFGKTRSGIAPSLDVVGDDIGASFANGEVGSTKQPHPTTGTLTTTFDMYDGNAVPAVGALPNYCLWGPLDEVDPPSQGLPNRAAAQAFATKYGGITTGPPEVDNGVDLVNGFTQSAGAEWHLLRYYGALDYSFIGTTSQTKAIGALGFPSMATSKEGISYPAYLPSVVIMSHKEIWVDVAQLDKTNCLMVSIGDIALGPSFTDAVEGDSILEITVAQSGVNDPEDYKYAVDRILVGRQEFVDLMEGDTVRCLIKNRTATVKPISS